jgi:hypothetical protein
LASNIHQELARHVVDTRFESSFLDLKAIPRRGQQYLQGTHFEPSFIDLTAIP